MLLPELNLLLFYNLHGLPIIKLYKEFQTQNGIPINKKKESHPLQVKGMVLLLKSLLLMAEISSCASKASTEMEKKIINSYKMRAKDKERPRPLQRGLPSNHRGWSSLLFTLHSFYYRFRKIQEVNS